MKTNLYKVHANEQVNGETFGFTVEYTGTNQQAARVKAYKEFGDSETFQVCRVEQVVYKG